MGSYKVDRTAVRRLILAAHNFNPSIRRLYREAGVENAYRGGGVWTGEATEAIAKYLGVPVEAIASPNGKQGRPSYAEMKNCPKLLPLSEDLRELISRAAIATNRSAADWAMGALRAAAAYAAEGDSNAKA